MHGHPNLVTIFSKRNHASVSEMQSITSVSSSHLVKYLVTVMMYLSLDILSCGLMGPAKSIAHLSNACNVTCGFNGISSRRDGLPTLFHTSQDWKYSFTTLNSVGHQILAHKNYCDFSFPA
jgi:hypothetical protein